MEHVHVEIDDLLKPKNANLRIRPQGRAYEVLSKKEELIRNPPTGVSQSAWEKWWHYKSPSNRAPGKAYITRTTNDFARLVKAGVTDFDKLVDYTIDIGWQGIGDETYSYTKSLIHQDKDMLLLRGIQ